jgi:cytochrome c-type biogenesis protein CcmH
MRRRLSPIVAVLLAGGLVFVTAAAAASIAPPKPIEIRTSATDVWPALMCVSCHEPLAVAQSPEAVSERQYVQHLVDLGYTRQQIIDIFQQQYGAAVLAHPPASGFNLTVYVLPPALLLAGIALLAYTLPRWRARARQASTEPMNTGDTPISSEDAERLARDLAAFD